MKARRLLLFTFAGLSVLGIGGCAGGVDTAGRGRPGEKMEVGPLDRSFMAIEEYRAFQARFDTVALQEPLVDMVQRLHSGIDILVFLGTWCIDSKREVPRFLKIADQAGIPMRQITLYGVDRKKSSGDGLAEKYKIERVPTFIFLKEGKEIGRIVESPRTTIEEEMVVILADTQK